MKETLAQRLARQMAEVHPGVVARVETWGGTRAVAPAQGEKEKLS